VSVDFLVKMRDSHQMAADAINEEIERKKPPEVKELPWAVDKIAWHEAQGSKGPYFRADPQATLDFKNMLQDIKNHGCKLTRDNEFFWVFTDMATVGRKRRTR